MFKAVVQVHQPQRFSDTLWKLCAALEAQLGSLVGCNAYITPANAQGLAPHWDDVSIFVLQTSGTVRPTTFLLFLYLAPLMIEKPQKSKLTHRDIALCY